MVHHIDMHQNVESSLAETFLLYRVRAAILGAKTNGSVGPRAAVAALRRILPSLQLRVLLLSFTTVLNGSLVILHRSWMGQLHGELGNSWESTAV